MKFLQYSVTNTDENIFNDDFKKKVTYLRFSRKGSIRIAFTMHHITKAFQ